MSKRVAVIGAGFGGLATAIRLQAAGLQVSLFEARDKLGGRAYVYEQDGFTFDGGPTVITAPHCLEELFEVAGERLSDSVELMPVLPFYRLLFSSGDSFDYDGDPENMRQQIAAWNPQDADGYERFVDYSRKVFEAGYEQLVDQPFLSFADMVKCAPALARLRADRSVYRAVSKFVDDERLRQALSFHSLLVGGNPFETSSIYTLIHYLERKWGVFFPRGGTGALVSALGDLLRRLGGQIHTSCPIERVRVERHDAGARHHVVSPREEESFDLVVANADVHHIYSRLYRDEPSAPRTVRKLERRDWSMSLFVLYFGTDRAYRDQVAHHTVLFGPRYRELLTDIFHGAAVPHDVSLYLHAPTVTDPSLAPPGCGTFYVLSPVPHLGNAPADWDALGPRYADRLLLHLESVLPDLRKHVVTRRWLTPVGFRDDLRSHLGSAFSLAPTLAQSAYFRMANRDPAIPGLYLVGAGTHPGAGVPGVVNSAKATCRVMAEDLGLQALRPSPTTREARVP